MEDPGYKSRKFINLFVNNAELKKVLSIKKGLANGHKPAISMQDGGRTESNHYSFK